MIPNKDPDASAVALFKHYAVPNDAKTLKEGRPIFDDIEIVEIRFPGSKDVKVFPATAVSHWDTDPVSGGQTKITYAERFSRQYQQFKASAAQTKSGTPLANVPFLTEGRRAELRALNVYTVEQLAAVDGIELKNLGQGGRELKNAAMEYIEEGQRSAPGMQLQAELEALRARNAVLTEDNEALKASTKRDSEFDPMSEQQIRDYITAKTGHAPLGNVSRQTLVRMAIEARSEKAA